MEMVDIDCNDCEHVNFSEWEQTDNRVLHFCNEYEKVVLHHGSNFELRPCKKCVEDKYKNFKIREI